MEDIVKNGHIEELNFRGTETCKTWGNTLQKKCWVVSTQIWVK